MLLRPYQQDIVAEVRTRLRKVRRVLLQLPTGGGKTAIASFITRNTIERGGTCWFLAHRDFLIDQTSKTYARLGIDHSFIAAGKWFNPWAPAQVAMVGTLRNRLKKILAQHGPPKVCIWDEAQHIGAATWAAIMDMLPDTIHIGLSATPQRLDGKGLDAYFDDIVLGPQPSWLIQQGFLSDYRMFAPSAPDLAGVHTVRGDFDRQEVDAAINKSVIVGDIVGHYRKLGMGKRGVYFNHSVDRSKALAEAFNTAGIPAKHLDGENSTWERKVAAQKFATGELMVLTNVDLFGEGYDLAAQAERDVTIELVGLCRPTQSLALHLQQIGRALRPKDEPAIILDHAGNWERHGLPDDDRQWSLRGIERKASVRTTQECDNCMAIVPINAVICKHCGMPMRDEEVAGAGGGGRQVEEQDGELHEVQRATVRAAKELEELQATSVHELIDIGKRRNYPDPIGWAAMMWTLKERRKKQKHLVDQQNLGFGAIREAAE